MYTIYIIMYKVLCLNVYSIMLKYMGITEIGPKSLSKPPPQTVNKRRYLTKLSNTTWKLTNKNNNNTH